MIFDAFESMVFYGAYHQNKVNKACHIVCVPLIWLTSISFMTLLPSEYPIHWIVYTVYCIIYLTLEPLAMVLYAPIFHSITLLGVHLTNYLSLSLITSLHLFGWIAQLYTHYAYEKRSPALKDNIVQALLMAPFFVWLEVLFIFNYRPHLQQELQIHIAKRYSQFKKG